MGVPVTGFCFGLIVFFSFWTTVVFEQTGGIIASLVIILAIIILNNRIEAFAREKIWTIQRMRMDKEVL